MTDPDIEYKSSYTAIFSSNYFLQGITQSMFAVIIPIYILTIISSISASSITLIASIILLPWSIKVFYGILSDKVAIKGFGRRRPWVIGPMAVAGICWIIIGIPGVLTPSNAILVFIVVGVIINVGVAMADTALDGHILDICPKEQLGRTQGVCWGLRSVGTVLGGPGIAVIIVTLGMTNIESIFMVLGFFVIITSLFTLMVEEPATHPEVIIGSHLKQMFNNKRDLKAYIFALFNAVLDGIVMLFVSIFLLIQMGVIELQGTNLSLDGQGIGVYLVQAYITFIVSIGIIFGAILGGQISDKISRKKSVYLGMLVTTIALLLMVIPTIVPILLFFGCLIGFAIGWRHSSYAAVIAEYSKNHPEMDSTYYSICNSFANFGSVLGLILTGIIFEMTASFVWAFLFMAIISNIGLIAFKFMNPAEYEVNVSE